MARPEEFWIQLQKVFNPNEILTGQRSKNFHCEREDSPLEYMRLDFRKELPPSIIFFTGHRGSGKSSALIRLLEHLKDDYFVVYFDIEYNLDTDRTNQIDLLYLLGAAIFQTAVNEGFSPDKTHLQGLAESVYTVTYEKKQKAKDEALNVVDLVKKLLVFGASRLGSELGEKLAEALLGSFTFSSGVSEEVARKREIEPRVQDIVDNVNLIIGDVSDLVKRPVLNVANLYT
ncbi:MAG: ATP-binding protein, partial [Nitrososphaera sp.]|nr:ATP-binding protein [Nitrososphaera sp.]